MAPHNAESGLESLGLYWHFLAEIGLGLRLGLVYGVPGINFTPQKHGITEFLVNRSFSSDVINFQHPKATKVFIFKRISVCNFSTE